MNGVVDDSGLAVLTLPVDTAQDLRRAYNLGLATNRLFLGAVVQSLPFRGDTVGAIFTRSIVQFFNDDISELFSNYNATAAEVFRIVSQGPCYS